MIENLNYPVLGERNLSHGIKQDRGLEEWTCKTYKA